MQVRLTPAQQSVAAHDHGPALVFASAGAGKTTTMVYRIERLVRNGIFPAERILATSFNRAAADSIGRSLKQRGVSGVQVKTLHALGYQLVGSAHRHGLLQADLERSRRNFETLDRQLLNRTLVEARRQQVSFLADLNRLDFDDFLDYLARCKGNLAYADLAGAQLPQAARKTAAQATAPDDKPWYLTFYRLYEDLRRQLGWITYDDMLMTGWEVLVRHPQILRRVQAQYHCVIVDEFQDVNLAQVEIIDRISRPHRNLMVIGDDDQTIYTWRGAASRFILDFQNRYGAQVYFLEENFRCSASQVALANAVIRHNQDRSPKQIKLTQGFAGATTLQVHADETTMGTAIATEIARLSRQPGSVAILVRLFAQTAPIEAALLRAGISYVVEGDLPFYQRPEVAALLDYGRLGQIEAQLLAGKPLIGDQADRFQQAWQAVANRPLRYIARSFVDECAETVVQNGQPLSAVLKMVARRAPSGVAERMTQLAVDLHWLAEQVAVKPPVHELLRDLEQRLGYAQALAKESGGEELGRARAVMVHAFIAFAEGQGSVDQILGTQAQFDKQSRRGRARVTITTIFRAKGLEWPVVFVPGCNEGMLPYARGASLEEERRLLYVAITRAQNQLYLHALENKPLSSLLVEAQANDVLSAVESVHRTLSSDPAHWQDEETLMVAVAGKHFGFDTYFAHWWMDKHKVQAAATVAALLDSLSAQGRLNRLGLDVRDLDFWRSLANGDNPVSGSDRASGRLHHPKEPSRVGWSRTRRNGQAVWASITHFFGSLRNLLAEDSKGKRRQQHGKPQKSGGRNRAA